MTELYRFRTTTRLLEDSKELEKQVIYFASPEELDDPMEGFRDIFWKGDRIVWTNLFRHYLYCLHMTSSLVRIAGDSEKIESYDIPVMSYLGQEPNPRFSELFEDICDGVFEKTKLHVFFAKLANTERKIRHDEILFYLSSLHLIALAEIQNAWIDHGLTSNIEKWDEFGNAFKHVHEIPDLLSQPEAEKSVDVMMKISSGIWQDYLLKYLLKYLDRTKSGGSLESNQMFLISDFPKSYLIQLERVLYPNWYVACFARDYGNSSMWAKYGDGHKGVCLIFESETRDGVNGLSLNQLKSDSNGRESWNPFQMEFHDVKYGKKVDEIDFFRTIGWWLPETKLKEEWYCDKDGNLSKCASHLETKTDTDAWRKAYWERFYPALSTKTLDWEYEEETRLVLDDFFGERDKQSRNLTYNFSSLKGLIFGIRTPDSEKLKIIEIISKKCHENGRNDFELFQAYYSHDTGRIQKYALVGLTIGN